MSDLNPTLVKRILDHMSSPAYRPLKRRQLGAMLGLTTVDAEYEEFKLTLTRMVSMGQLAKLRGNRFELAQRAKTVSGRLTVRGTNYGFVHRGTGQGIVEIRRGNFGGAMHGDVVEIELLDVGGGDRNPTGRVVKIVSAGKRIAVGTVVEGRDELHFIPIRGGVFPEVPLDGSMPNAPHHGEIVTVEYTRDRFGGFQGSVLERLGESADYSSTIEAILRAFEIPGSFSPEVVAEAQEVFDTPADTEGRENLTGLFTITIDPADAKDFDDALSCEQIEGGWRVLVHIADVSAAVPRNSVLDVEARKRGTSVYLPGFVVPMLPHQLSNERCCLAPNQPRLAKTVVLEYDQNGLRLGYRVLRSVILSDHRLDYGMVQGLISGNKATLGRGPECDELVRTLWSLASILRKRRADKGSIMLDMPEVRVTLDKTGMPTDLTAEYGDESHSLIEEFMLEANRAVAELMIERDFPALHRVHDEPDDDMLTTLRAVLGSFGLPVSKQIRRADLADIIEAVSRLPYSRVVNLSILRTMKMATYSPEPTGHYALAFERYLHFTSPIRRYPDLFVHQELDRRYFKVSPLVPDPDGIDDIALQASDTERNAQECERNIVQLKTLEYLARFRGEEFEAVVTGVKEFGIIVELTRFLVDGLIHVREMGNEFFQMSEDGARMLGERGTQFRPGQLIRVKIADVDLPRRRLELRFAGLAGTPAGSSSGGGNARPRKPSGIKGRVKGGSAGSKAGRKSRGGRGKGRSGAR